MKKEPKKYLGKGLAELIDMNEVQFNISKNVHFQEVNIDSVEPIDQPRYNFDKENLEELAASIKQHGMLQPILVREKDGKFIIIAGERRWRAAKLLGMNTVPIISKSEYENHFVLSIIENTQRSNFSPVEEAKAYKKLIEEYNYTQEEIAKVVSKSRSYIANSLRILNLPENVLDLLDSKQLTQGHAKLLLSVKNPEEIAEKIVNKELSVRKTEKLINYKTKTNDNTRLDVLELEVLLSKRLGFPMKIITNKNGGKISINFKNDLELDEIVEKLNR